VEVNVLSVRTGLVLSMLFLATNSWGQQPSPTTPAPQRDPQATTILNQAVGVAGGFSSIAAIRDVSANGTITYFWAGQEVHGTIAVKAMVEDKLRIDATVPDGVRTVVLNYGGGSIKETDGRIRQVTNVIGAGTFILPIYHVVSTLQDVASGVNYLGLESSSSGEQLHHVRTQKLSSGDSTVDATITNLGTRDVYIDAKTLLITSTVDFIKPNGQKDFNFPHLTQLGDYRTVNGIQIPFSIAQFNAGQQTSTIQLNQVSFNVGLTDADFQAPN
jgi:hypothetical protein